MRKILIGLSAALALLVGTVSAFAENGFGVGVALSQAKLSTEGSEVETGSQSAETNRVNDVQNSFAIGSIFAEYTYGWLTLGVDYIPSSAEVSDATHIRNDTETSVTGTDTATATARTQKAAAQIKDHTTAYLEIGSALYAKAGFVQVTVDTDESLATGSTYGNVDIEGTLLGVGYKSDWGSNGFIKVEGTFTDYDDISITSGVARTGVTTNNVIKADMDASQLKLGIGYRF